MWDGNSTPKLNYDLEIPVKYTLINGADYDHRILINESEEKNDDKLKIRDLIKKYPDAVYVGLSKINFNEEKNEASVYVESLGSRTEQYFWKKNQVLGNYQKSFRSLGFINLFEKLCRINKTAAIFLKFLAQVPSELRFRPKTFLHRNERNRA